MKKLALVVVAVLALSGCAASSAEFTDARAQDVVFGQSAQAELSAIGLTHSGNTISKDSVSAYVAGTVTDSKTTFSPEKCTDAVYLLILGAQDAGSTDTFYAFPSLTSGQSVINVKARLFASDDAAKAFVEKYEKANQDCRDVTATQGTSTDRLQLTVSEAAKDGKGFRLDTLAGVDTKITQYRTYIVREGNLVVAVQGAVPDDASANLVVGASAAIYAQMTAASE